mgnify:CR=1 FL=1
MSTRRRASPSAASGHAWARRWWTLAGLSLAAFLLTLGDTALAVALPSIGRDLNLDLGGLEWVVNAYTLALSVFLLAGGRLADLLGARRVFLVGMAVFTGASLVSGLARSDWLLLGGRVLQGAGGALVLPATLALVTVSFRAGGRGVALGVWSGAGAAALALGPLAGALVTEQLGWAWIFLLNVPLGAAGLLAGRLTLPETDGDRERGFDVAGLVWSGAGLFALVFGLTEAPRYGWASPAVLGSFAAATVAFAVLVRVELAQAAPLVDLRRLRARTVSGANAVMLLSTAVMCSVLFFVSLYLQTSLGYSPLGTGAVFLPMTGLILVVAPFAGRFSDRRGDRAPAAAGMLLMALGLALLAELGLEGGLVWLLPSLTVIGLGIGLVTTPVTAAALAGAPQGEDGVAAGILNTSRMVGLSLGIALMGAIVAARWPGGFAAAPVPATTLADGLSLAFLVNAGIALVTAALAAATLRGRGRAEAAEPPRLR